MNDTKVKYIIFMLIIIIALSIVDVVAAKTKDPPMPYTTPKISYQRTVIRISWYNTVPKIYTVTERNEKCTRTYCTLTLAIRYRKYIPVGNVRINIKRTNTTSQYSVH